MDIKVYQGIKILTGICSWSEWQKHTRWKVKKQCRIDCQRKRNLEDLKNIIISKNISFIFFNGSWCPDSMEEMPLLYKLFESADIPCDMIRIIGLDMDKSDSEGFSKKYYVEHLPTLVVLKDKEEIGRIVEHPVSGWEKSLLGILRD
jgi:thiol-disulfide isomerase/thioredoxin